MKPIFIPKIFQEFKNVVAGVSSRDSSYPNEYGMLPRDDAIAIDNRADFAKRLGFSPDKFVVNREIHEDRVLVIDKEWQKTEADSTITQTPGWLLGVTSGDCVGALIFDPVTAAYGIFHSGWRGCRLNIAGKVIGEFERNFGSKPSDLRIYLNPAICGQHFEIGENLEPTHEIIEAFDPKYIHQDSSGMYFLDHRAIVVDQLKLAGIDPEHLEVDLRCTYEDQELHSDRRDHVKTGRIVAAIGLKA